MFGYGSGMLSFVLPKLLDVTCAMQQVQNLDAVFNRAVENQIVLKTLYPERSQVAQPRRRKWRRRPICGIRASSWKVP